MTQSEVKHREEIKRDWHWTARERWRLLQEAITWAERQATVRRNTAESCLKEQARKTKG